METEFPGQIFPKLFKNSVTYLGPTVYYLTMGLKLVKGRRGKVRLRLSRHLSILKSVYYYNGALPFQ